MKKLTSFILAFLMLVTTTNIRVDIKAEELSEGELLVYINEATSKNQLNCDFEINSQNILLILDNDSMNKLIENKNEGALIVTLNDGTVKTGSIQIASFESDGPHTIKVSDDSNENEYILDIEDEEFYYSGAFVEGENNSRTSVANSSMNNDGVYEVKYSIEADGLFDENDYSLPFHFLVKPNYVVKTYNGVVYKEINVTPIEDEMSISNTITYTKDNKDEVYYVFKGTTLCEKITIEYVPDERFADCEISNVKVISGSTSSEICTNCDDQGNFYFNIVVPFVDIKAIKEDQNKKIIVEYNQGNESKNLMFNCECFGTEIHLNHNYYININSSEEYNSPLEINSNYGFELISFETVNDIDFYSYVLRYPSNENNATFKVRCFDERLSIVADNGTDDGDYISLGIGSENSVNLDNRVPVIVELKNGDVKCKVYNFYYDVEGDPGHQFDETYDSASHKGYAEAKHVINHNNLQQAIDETKLVPGGVIVIDGSGQGEEKTLELTSDITILHRYSDNANSSGGSNLGHSSYEDFLLIDLQADIDAGDYGIKIGGYEGFEQSDENFNSKVLINGHGHTITSSGLYTLALEYNAMLIVNDVKIVNTNASKDACALYFAGGTFIGDYKSQIKSDNIGVSIVPVDTTDESNGMSSSFDFMGNIIGKNGEGLVIDGLDECLSHNKEKIYRRAWAFVSVNNVSTEKASKYAIVEKGDDNTNVFVNGRIVGGIHLGNGHLSIFNNSTISSGDNDCIKIDSTDIDNVNIYLSIDGNDIVLESNKNCIKEYDETSKIKSFKINDGSFTCGDSYDTVSLGSSTDRKLNNISIRGGSYNKKFASSYINTITTHWNNNDPENGPYTLICDSSSLIEVSDVSELKTAISGECENIKLTKDIELNEVVEIPYKTTIDLNSKSITGGTLKFTAPQIEGEMVGINNLSFIKNGNLVAKGNPIVDSRSLLKLSNCNISSGNDYSGYLIDVIDAGLLHTELCTINGTKGINYNLQRDFNRDGDSDISSTTITTTDIAINAVGKEDNNEYTIGFGNGTTIVSGSIAINSDCVKVLLFGSSIEAKTCIKTTYSIDLDQKCKLKSIGSDDKIANAAIIFNNTKDNSFRIPNFVDNNSLSVTSENKYAIIVKGYFGGLDIKNGNYSACEGIIDTTSLINKDPDHPSRLIVRRGRYSHKIPNEYMESDQFECIRADNTSMPFAVARKFDKVQIGDYDVQAYLVADSDSTSINPTALANALGSGIDTDKTLIFNASQETESKIETLASTLGDNNEIVDCYDLHIDEVTVNGSETTFNRQSEVESLQTITLQMSQEAINNVDNLVVFHEGNRMKLVDKGDASNEECAYIDGSNVVIKTKNFSSFSVAKAEHVKVTKIEATEATCDAAGNSEYYRCDDDDCGKYFSDANCNNEIEADSWVIAKKDHTYSSEWSIDENYHWHAATCAHTNEVSEKAEHTWDNGTVSTPAKCNSKGVMTYTCTVCNTTKTEEIEFAAHTLVHYDEVPATCTKAGTKEYYECSVCKKKFEDEECTKEISNLVLPIIEHTYDKEVATEAYLKSSATCTQKAVYYKSCVCGEKGNDTFEYGDTLPHVLQKTDAKQVTCTEDGNSAYWYCDNCKQYFSDAYGLNVIEENSWIINKLGHSLVKTDAKEASCTEKGNTEYYYCSRCKEYFSDSLGTNKIVKDSWIVSALGHDYEGNICKHCGQAKATIPTEKEVENKANALAKVQSVVASVSPSITTNNPSIDFTSTSLTVTPKVEVASSGQIASAIDKVQEEINGKEDVKVEYLDLSVDIFDGTSTGQLSDLGVSDSEGIEFVIQLPDEFKPTNGYVIKLYRIHNNVLEEIPNATVDANGILTMKSSKFSIFVVVKEKQTSSGGNNGGGAGYQVPKTCVE